MWQQRIKAWLDAVRARFARRGERTTHGDIDAYESRYEAGVVGARGGFDLRRSALPLTIGAIARAVGGGAGAAPAGAGRRPRRGRRAHQPRHRRRQRVERGQRLRRARPAADARLLAARPELARGADEPRRRAGAAAVGRGPLARRRPDGALRASIRSRSRALAKSLPDDVGAEIVEPAAQGVIYKVFARYTVREIFSTKRSRDPGRRSRTS